MMQQERRRWDWAGEAVIEGGDLGTVYFIHSDAVKRCKSQLGETELDGGEGLRRMRKEQK